MIAQNLQITENGRVEYVPSGPVIFTEDLLKEFRKHYFGDPSHYSAVGVQTLNALFDNVSARCLIGKKYRSNGHAREFFKAMLIFGFRTELLRMVNKSSRRIIITAEMTSRFIYQLGILDEGESPEVTALAKEAAVEASIAMLGKMYPDESAAKSEFVRLFSDLFMPKVKALIKEICHV